MRKNNTTKKTRAARLVRVPIIGTVGDAGLRLNAAERKLNADFLAGEVKRARREARTVAAFLNGGAPDFLMGAMMSAIDDAFNYHGLPKPSDDLGVKDYDEQNLYPLFLKTKLTNWGDLYPDEHRVSDSVLELLHNPQTPEALYQAVAGFLCDQSNKGPNLFHTAFGVSELLKTVRPEDLRGEDDGREHIN